MMFELSKQISFDCAHTLSRTIDAESSRRIHGHSYEAEITLRGLPDPETAMLVDLGHFALALKDIRDALDGHLLDDVEGLGRPTLENLCIWVWNRLSATLPGLHKVTISRKNLGDACSYWGGGAP